MTKSKSVIGKEKQTFNPEYYEAVTALIDNTDIAKTLKQIVGPVNE